MAAASLFIVLIITLIIGLPIGVSLGLTSLSASIFDPNLPANIEFVYRNSITAIDSYPLLAVPLFILAGVIMARGGISKKLFDFFAFFIGNVTGGLPAAVIVTCLFYGAISGSGPATTAAVGAMTIPILVNLGYDKLFSVSLVATAGSLGVIIPPSIPFIVYGLSSGASVGTLFIAGILPGILVGFCLIGYAYYYCKTQGEDKEKLYDNYRSIRDRGFWNIFKDSFWALLSPIIILGGIYGGVVTPTEAADIAVIYALIVSMLIYRTLSFKDIPSILKESINTVAPALFVVSMATVFGRVITMMQVPQLIASTIIGTFQSEFLILLIIILLLLLVGMIMETLASILILTPLLLPIATSIGIDPIHFGVIMVVSLAIGFVTPPVGMNLYIASGMTGLSVTDISRKAVPFILAFLIALFLIAYIPEISLILT